MPAYYFVTTFNAINQCIGHYGNMGYQVSRRGIQNQIAWFRWLSGLGWESECAEVRL